MPETMKLILSMTKSDLKATDKDFEKMANSSKYRYEEYMLENEFGMLDDFFSKTKFTKE